MTDTERENLYLIFKGKSIFLHEHKQESLSYFRLQTYKGSFVNEYTFDMGDTLRIKWQDLHFISINDTFNLKLILNTMKKLEIKAYEDFNGFMLFYLEDGNRRYYVENWIKLEAYWKNFLVNDRKITNHWYDANEY